MQKFLAEPDLLDMKKIPGIGEKTEIAITKGTSDLTFQINTGYALFGVFMSLKGKDADCVMHCNRFYNWLHTMGVKNKAHTIVRAIAERANLSFTGLYDDAAFGKNSLANKIEHDAENVKHTGKAGKVGNE
jgi:hypothetical protein